MKETSTKSREEEHWDYAFVAFIYDHFVDIYFNFFWIIHRSEIAESRGNFIINFQMFSMWLDHFTSSVWVLVAPYPQETLDIFRLFYFTYSRVCKWYLIAVLFYIFLITNYVEHIFTCSLVIRILYFAKVQTFCSFFNWFFWLFVIDLQNLFMYSDFKSFVRYIYRMYLPPKANILWYLVRKYQDNTCASIVP